MNVDWRELYQAALLELRHEELRQKIDDAEKSIQQRMAELRQDNSNSDSDEESLALDDALRGLRVLASTECKSPQPTLAVSARSEVTS